MTKRLGVLLARAKPKAYGDRVVDQLAKIFDTLGDGTSWTPKVEELKERGPKYFATSERQEDAQNYLIEVMQTLEGELKKEKLLE